MFFFCNNSCWLLKIIIARMVFWGNWSIKSINYIEYVIEGLKHFSSRVVGLDSMFITVI